MQTSHVIKYFEAKSQQPIFRWFLNAFLILIIFVNAQVGFQLGIPGYPLHISAVWPPTGFALAGLLLFGYWTWPGIFLGNFCFNLMHLLAGPEGALIATIVAIFISLGSTLQAVVAGYIIQKLSKNIALTSFRDILIFFIPGGILPCLIASSIGTTALYVSGILPKALFLYTWVTFWIGDAMGVYIFTPLIVIWSLFHPRVLFRKYRIEALALIAGYMLVTLLTFFTQEYPLEHLFLPLSFWAAYRFRRHGATLATFVLMLAIIVPTALGKGPYIAGFADPLLMFIIYIGVVALTSLLLAALLNERDEAILLAHKLQREEGGAQDRFLELGDEEEPNFVSMDVASFEMSLAQDPNITFDSSNLIIEAKEEEGYVQVYVTLPKYTK